MTASAALDLLAGLALEDGRPWGDAAVPVQWDDARAILDVDGPPYHYLTRARGYSKTSDLAGIALAVMLAQLGPGARLYAVAASRDQARLLLDAMAGFVQRTPGLGATVDASAFKVTGRSGAVLEVLAADAASAFGLRPSFMVVDELAAWASTAGPRRLWEATSSAMAKVPGARLAVLTTAGDPAHWSHKVLVHAYGDDLWRVNEVEGPPPWADRGRLAEQARRLPSSSYARLFENRWTSPEDRLTSVDDLRGCVGLDGPLEPVRGVRYVIGVDLGLKHDRTVAAVCHSDDGGVVLDRMEVWQGRRFRSVDLGAVEEWVGEAAGRYNRAQVVCDPWQAIAMVQRLRRVGLRVEEFSFSSQSVGRLATALYSAIREQRLLLPDDPDLLDELANVRLRETSPGVLRMDHDADKHDDRAVALGLAVLHLGQLGGRTARFVVYPEDAAPVAPDRVAAPAAGRFRVYTEGSDRVLDEMRRRRRDADPWSGPPQRVW